MDKGLRPEEFSVEIRNRAIREALRQIPVQKARAILSDCGLTKEEQKSLLDHNSGADLTRISTEMNVSDRTLDRRRASALHKLRVELET